MHGFKDAEDYWHQSSSLYFLKSISCSTLMVNSQDDPFIPPDSIPFSTIHHQDQLDLLTPRYGGHVGFGNWRLNDMLWHEDRVMAFLQQQGL
ncbi:MAG: hypothetical protein BRD49_04530 [Bacteroidetes bacterium SW_10_40_5]|nr:MAG: hypothetical protein BRD49_04530 [Bacteroidetes bacterium SW_10_40_5]